MKKLMSVVFLALTAFAAVAEEGRVERSWKWSPLGVGIAAPIQLPFTDTDIYGLRFGGLLGVNRNVYGIDAGLVEVSGGEFCGIQLGGLLNYNVTLEGVQLGGLLNWQTSNFAGVQIGGLANIVKEDGVGFSVGGLNLMNRFVGVELGGVNLAEECVGLQLGIFNGANKLSGVQIGLLNLVCTDPLFNIPVMPVVNASF